MVLIELEMLHSREQGSTYIILSSLQTLSDDCIAACKRLAVRSLQTLSGDQLANAQW